MKLTKTFIASASFLVVLLGIFSIMILSLQEHDDIEKGSFYYHVFIDERLKDLEITENKKHDFRYIPADGTSPEVHILKIHNTDSGYLNRSTNSLIQQFKSYGFKQNDNELVLGTDIVSTEFDESDNLSTVYLYIYE